MDKEEVRKLVGGIQLRWRLQPSGLWLVEAWETLPDGTMREKANGIASSPNDALYDLAINLTKRILILERELEGT